MEIKTKLLPKYLMMMNKEILNKKAGIFITAIVSLFNIAMSLPFFTWINLVNISKLFSKIGVSREMAEHLYSGYGIFNLLSFVQEAKKGVLGLYAMIMLICILMFPIL